MSILSSLEISRLRGLAHLWQKAAHDPVNAERAAAWLAHNDGHGYRPMIVMEMDTFASDMLHPKLTQPLARELEWLLLYGVTTAEEISDDKVLPDYLPVPMKFTIVPHNVTYETDHAIDSAGRSIGYMPQHVIHTLPEDLAAFGESVYIYQQAETEALLSLASDVFGDILPPRLYNASLQWAHMPMSRAVLMMGMEALYVAMMTQPDDVHHMLDLFTTETIGMLHWMEAQGHLTPNNRQQIIGAGSVGYTDALPGDKGTGRLRARDLWGNTNAQEAVGLSPDMFAEFVMPYASRIAEEYGMMYYGCCEGVHAVWDTLKTLPHLRKVSVSAWCDERLMGEYLQGSGVIYSRKPSPNYIGAEQVFDEDAFRKHIDHTVTCAQGVGLEIIFRDVYTLMGERGRAGRAVAIARAACEAWR